MHKALRFLFLAGASLFLAGCSTTDQRVSALDVLMQDVRVLETGLTVAEARLSKVESELGGLRAAPAQDKADTGKKGKAREEKRVPAPAAVRTPPEPAMQASSQAPSTRVSSRAPAEPVVTGTIPLPAQPAPRLDYLPAPAAGAAPQWDYQIEYEATERRELVALDLPLAAPDETWLDADYTLVSTRPLAVSARPSAMRGSNS